MPVVVVDAQRLVREASDWVMEGDEVDVKMEWETNGVQMY
jgi:hypothetical protein